jgi:hypothetical protein
VLIVCTILNTLHAEDDGYDGQMTRHRFFFIFIAASFFYYFLPGKSNMSLLYEFRSADDHRSARLPVWRLELLLVDLLDQAK